MLHTLRLLDVGRLLDFGAHAGRRVWRQVRRGALPAEVMRVVLCL